MGEKSERKIKPEIKKEGGFDWKTKKEILSTVDWNRKALESLLSSEQKEKMSDTDIKKHKKLEEALSSYFKKVKEQVKSDNPGDEFYKEMGFRTGEEREALMKLELWRDIQSRLSTEEMPEDVRKYIIEKLIKYDNQVSNFSSVRKTLLMESQQPKKERGQEK